ncbi:hypothetical protein Q8G81_34175, partial [Klebsiella pneumoniae]
LGNNSRPGDVGEGDAWNLHSQAECNRRAPLRPSNKTGPDPTVRTRVLMLIDTVCAETNLD